MAADAPEAPVAHLGAFDGDLAGAVDRAISDDLPYSIESEPGADAPSALPVDEDLPLSAAEMSWLSIEEEEREAEQEDPEYQRRLESGRARRARQESVYADDFLAAVRQFLAFHPRYQTVEMEMARRIAEHATPVGSGTVARTRRIPLEERAEAAVIAWMRHQTTAYDSLSIPRIAGARRDVRRQLAQRSRELLARYRSAAPFALELCPLHRALLHRSRT